jgi:hypothetical protein
MAYKDNLTAEYVRSILDYDMETGEFTWRFRPEEHFKTKRIFNSWNAKHAKNIAGGANKRGYWTIRINGTGYLAHRLAWLIVNGAWPSYEIDHKNNRKTDNFISNLRPSMHPQNGKNRSLNKNNKSGYKGVYFKKKISKWAAQIKVNYKSIHIGYYDTPLEAAIAYNSLAGQYHGEFAKLNEIPKE